MWPFTRKQEQQIASKSPSRAARRAYAGAMHGRLVADWVAGNASIDQDLRGSLLALRNRSRQLGRDNDYVRNFFRDVQNNVVGDNGIVFQSQVRMLRGGKLDEATNDAIERAWERWCRADSAHTGGKLAFAEIERLVMRTTVESGEFIVRFVFKRMGKSKVPLSLELIEADRLDEQYNGRYEPTGNQVRMGVEVNEWLRPVAYHFWGNHPNDLNQSSAQARARVRIPAEEILHDFIPDRMNQNRGLPWLASAILRLHHMQGYEEAEVIAARASAALMGFIESPDEEPSLTDDKDAETGQSVTEFEPGIFKKLLPGEKVNIPTLSRPAGQFEPFVRLMLRGVAAGAGASYESLSGDYSQSNYSSSRMALLPERDNWRAIQKWLIRSFHQKVFEKWLDLAVLSGEVALKSFETNAEAYYGVKWMPRGWAWVDPAKEVHAYQAAVRNGFMTQADVVAQSGYDLEELMIQRSREKEMADKYGLVFDTDPSQVSVAGQAQVPPPDPSGDPAKPEKAAGSAG